MFASKIIISILRKMGILPLVDLLHSELLFLFCDKTATENCTFKIKGIALFQGFFSSTQNKMLGLSLQNRNNCVAFFLSTK